MSSKVRGINLEVVIAIGHADSIGSDAYNQRLSVRRAESIKAYLVSKGIEPNRVYTEGKGEKQSLTAGKCKNMGKEHRSNKKMVDCLGPDRRVEIEVIGTRRP
jgi:OOP family OmpA-OmpF porin